MTVLPELERELVRAAARTAVPTGSRRRAPLGGWALIVGGALAAAAVVVVVVLAGAGGSRDVPAAPGGGANGTPRRHAVPRSEIGGFVLAADFPAGAADWAAAEQLGAFESAVRDKATAACMRARGFPAPPPTPITFTAENAEFPDLGRIARTGSFSRPSAIGVPHLGDRRNGTGRAARGTPESGALQRCRAVSADLFATMNAAAPLENAWQSAITRLQGTPRVRVALRRFARCTRAAGAPSNSIGTFLSFVDTQTIPLILSHRRAQAATTERHLAEVFARCLGPAQALIVRLRHAQRTMFFAAHAAQVQHVRAAQVALVTRLGGKYGVRLTREG